MSMLSELFSAGGGSRLPPVTSADNGDALGVVDGEWDVLDLSGQIAHLQEQIDDLNYHEITLSVSVSPNTAEIGSVPSSVTVSWSCNKKPTTLTVAGQSIANPGKTGSVTLSTGITGSTQSFTVVAVDERNHTETKTAMLNYYNRVFWGAAAEASTVTAGTGTLSNTKARTISGVTAGSGEYVWYILPNRLCSTAPKFTVGGFEGGFSLNKTENWTNSSGYTESYDYYRSDNAALGAVTVVVS